MYAKIDLDIFIESLAADKWEERLEVMCQVMAALYGGDGNAYKDGFANMKELKYANRFVVTVKTILVENCVSYKTSAGFMGQLRD